MTPPGLIIPSIVKALDGAILEHGFVGCIDLLIDIRALTPAILMIRLEVVVSQATLN